MIRALSRPLLASAFALDGVAMVRNSTDHIKEGRLVSRTLRTVLPPAYRAVVPANPAAVTRAMGVTKTIAAGMLATSTAPRVAAGTLAALQVPAALSRHAFWKEPTKEAKKAEMQALVTDLALLGGLAITSADTAGKPSLVWRAKKALPGKSEQQKMLENAQAQTKELAAQAQDQAQELFVKGKGVASQVQDKVAVYVDEHSDDWKAAAENLRDQAYDLRDSAIDYAEDRSKDMQKQAKKANRRFF